MKQSVTIIGENLNVVMNEMKSVSAKKTKAEKRMETLRAMGYDMSRFFTFGGDDIYENKDGKAVAVDFESLGVNVDDPVEKKLVEGGYVNNWKLFRRFVMAQMFGMLRDMFWKKKSFNELLQSKGYEYQWSMLERELYAQLKMAKHGDNDNFVRRSRWFDSTTAHSMAVDYIVKLKKYIDDNLIYRRDKYYRRKYKHTCHGIAYVRLSNTNIFVCDLQKKVYRPLVELADNISSSESIADLYKSVVAFNKARKHLGWGTKQADAFISAFKGSGSYYTMRNLIMFHGASFKKLGRDASLSLVERKASECASEGWRMLGLLKQLIDDSGISIEAKIEEWSK